MYQVVEFSNGGGIGVVSKYWMTPKKNHCRWPNTKRPIDMKILQFKPDDNWKSYGVDRIFYATDDLLKARDRAKRAEIESEFSANSNEGSPMVRKRYHARGYDNQNNSSSDEEKRDSDNDIIFPPTPAFLSKTNADPSSSVSSSAGTDSLRNNNNKSAEATENTLETTFSSDSLDLTLKPTTQQTSGPGPLDVVSRHLARIENSLKELQLTQNEILDRLRSASTKTPMYELPEGIKIPCNDLESLQALESVIKTDENDKLLENYLSFVGGDKTSAIIRRILEKLFTNHLALSCNWTGKNNKTALKNLTIVNVIKGYGRLLEECKNIADQFFNKYFDCEWLPQLCTNETKKKKKFCYLHQSPYHRFWKETIGGFNDLHEKSMSY